MRKQNKYLIITCVTLLIGAIVCFLVGGALGGWDIKKIFTSTPAIMSYIILGTTLIAIGFMVIKDKINKL